MTGGSEALAGHVDGLAAGDALDDEGGVLVDEDGHQTPASTFSTARRAASDMETVRSQYSTPYFARSLNPSPSQEQGMRKMAIFSAGSWPDSTTPLTTPRATMSTRVLETTFMMTAIFWTSGLLRMSLVSAAALATLGLPPISQ